MPVMRMPLLAAAAALLLGACGTSTPSSPTTSPAPPPPTETSATPSSSSAAAGVLTWGGDGSSSGVYIKVGAPVTIAEPVAGADGKPDPAFRFVEAPVTAGNKTDQKARVSFSGRVGSKEAPWTANDSVPEALPGETAEFTARFKVAADARELIVEVYANVGGGVTSNRLNFKGPIS
jgi:hypothetical protein